MKINDYEGTIKDKIDSLGTLDGGIVFGREEAWEKLQGRLDKKPARKIPLRMWLAAAAVLVAMVSVGAYFSVAPRETVAGTNEAKGHGPLNVRTAATPMQEQPLPNTSIVPHDKPAQAEAKTYTAVSSVHGKKEQVNALLVVHPVKDRQGNKPVSPAPVVVVSPDSAPAPANGLKVVHLNDLAASVAGTGNMGFVAATPATAGIMRVVHINDLAEDRNQKMLEEYEANMRAKEQWQNTASTSKSANEHNPFLKIRRNTQN